MTRRAVIVCPGRGTYNAQDLGSLTAYHADKTDLRDRFDAIRVRDGMEPLHSLDGATRFSVARHTRGENASALIYACTLFDAMSLAGDIDILAVTGNSMGWYSALAVGGALSPEDGFRVANTMGRLMQESLIGGQVLYPITEEDWRPDAAKRARIFALVNDVNIKQDCTLALSIDLGGMLVLAGNEAGLAAFEAAVPVVQERFPMRLANHAAFHTSLQAPVAARGRELLQTVSSKQPKFPLIDGRGHVWWPGTVTQDDVWDYTLNHQVVEPYDFAAAIRTAAREFAPDLFIITGPGTTLGGAVAQSLIACNWLGMDSRARFRIQQTESSFLVSMGRADQRPHVLRPRALN